MKEYKKKRKIFGYTLADVSLVLIIIGSTMMFAIPKFTYLLERVKAHGQHQILLATYKAMIEKYKETGNFGPSTAIWTHPTYGIDDVIDFPNLSPDFNPPLLHCPQTALCAGGGGVEKTCVSPVGVVAEMQRIGAFEEYSLYVTWSGKIICRVDGASGCDTVCRKLGYPTDFTPFRMYET